MSTKKIQIKPPDNSYGDVLHPETESSVVLMANGSTLEQDINAVAAGGTATAITIAKTGFTAYNNMYMLTFIASANNSGAATTININGKGAKQLYKPGTTTAPTLVAGKAYTIWYNSTSGCFFVKASADGTAVAGDVLAGVTFSNDSDTGIAGSLALTGSAVDANVLAGKTYYNTAAKTKRTGAMVEQGTQTATLSITGSAKPTKAIAEGHINASTITAQLDAALASVIKSGSTIGGVAGTYSAKQFASGVFLNQTIPYDGNPDGLSLTIPAGAFTPRVLIIIFTSAVIPVTDETKLSMSEVILRINDPDYYTLGQVYTYYGVSGPPHVTGCVFNADKSISLVLKGGTYQENRNVYWQTFE